MALEQEGVISSGEDLFSLLGELDDEIRAVPKDEIERKLALLYARDKVSAMLRASNSAELAEANEKWAAQAGHKGEHAVDEDVILAWAKMIGMGRGHGGS